MDFIIKSYKKGEFLLEFRKADILGVRVAALTMGEAVKTAEAFMDRAARRSVRRQPRA